MSEFKMPSLGADMDSATLVEWLVKPGDSVVKGDVIAVIESAKGAIEVEVFESGEIEDLLVDIDTEVSVGTPLARIRDTDEASIDSTPVQTQAAEEASKPPPKPAPVSVPVPDPTDETALQPTVLTDKSPESRLLATPQARAAARDKGLDLALVSGSGPEGAILYRDLSMAKESSVKTERSAGTKSAPGPGFDPAAMREAIAKAMARSKREIPHYYLQTTLDMSFASTWLADYNRRQEPANRLIMSALLIRATVLALQAYPEFNGFWQDNAFSPSPEIHLGMAINIRSQGLMTPALRNTEQASLPELMLKLQDVTQRTRKGGLRSSEIGTATVTVTSLGERGVDTVFGVIFPPQVAILGFGRMHNKPVAVDDGVAVRPVIEATLAADHRVSDGHRGALFLDQIHQLLKQPDQLSEHRSVDQGDRHE